MKKKIAILFIILILLVACGLAYLNQVILPTKVKSLIVNNLRDFTQKEVTLQSLSFNLFKGLVLKGLKIGNGKEILLTLKEGSCSLLILPFFKKQIIIPKISLDSVQIFIQRRQDLSFNILDLINNNLALRSSPKNNFNIIINKVIFNNASIVFQDNALTPPFKEEINAADLILWLSLPDKVKFKLKFSLAGQSAKFNSSGEYSIKAGDLKADISAKNFYPQEFLPYYKNLGFLIPKGKLDAQISLGLKNQIVSATAEISSQDLTIIKEAITANINSLVKVNLTYGLKDRKFDYFGSMDITGADVTGIETIKEINNLKGKINFSNSSGLNADKLTASILGFPLELNINLADFNNPRILILLLSDLDLDSAQKVLMEKFNLSFPVDIKGSGRLNVLMQVPLPFKGLPKVEGSLVVSQAAIKLQQMESPFTNVSAKLKFDLDGLSWDELKFNFSGQDYKSSGTLSNFKAPEIKLALSGDNLSLDSYITLNNKIIKLSKFSGHYLNSAFNVIGDIDISRPGFITTNLKTISDINLQDLRLILRKNEDQLKQIKPQGMLHAEVSLAGNIMDWKLCVIKSKFSSNRLSFYGLKAQDLDLCYNQQDGVGDISSAQMSLYDGLVSGSGKINLQTANLAYWVEAGVEGLKIEKLKMDTPAKAKNIAGTIQARIKLSGFVNDLEKLSGAGKILVTDGKLWELDLFQGLGSLLFTHDFSRILFSQGSCDFIVKDKYVFTDNLSLKSNLSDIAGSVKIGFDSSLNASLSVQVNEDIPLSGTLKDVTTAIMGSSGRFGVIRITGTLQKPKYDFKAAVTDILKGLTDAFLKKRK
jgi:hypothetical protein